MASQDDMLAQANGLNANLAQLVTTLLTRFALAAFSGSFSCGAAASTVVTDANAKTTSKITLTPTNAAAGTLQSGAKHLYVTKANGSFIVLTADGNAAAGTETFDYLIVNVG